MDSGGDRIRVLDAIGRQFDELEAREAPRRPSHSRPRALIAAVTAAVALTVLSLTPPGQAVADRLGELIGIGDEPSGSPGFGTPAVVIGVGESPDGVAFEIVASRSDDDAPGGRETCIGLDLPGLSGVRVAECLADRATRTLESSVVIPTVYAAPDELGPDSELMVEGLVRADAAEVTVTYPSPRGERQAPVHLAQLNDVVARLIGAPERAGFFAGFIPEGVLAGSAKQPRKLTEDSIKSSLSRILITVRDARGQILVASDASDLARALRPPGGSPLLADPPDGFHSGAGNPPMQGSPHRAQTRRSSGG